jgi:hypothetical protein
MATSNLHSMNIIVYTYLMSQMFMTVDVRRKVTKALMPLTPDVASKMVYGVDLPQGLQHESTQVDEDEFPMEEDEVALY